MELKELLQALPTYHKKTSLELIHILDIADDSRDVAQGTLFVCVEGYMTDGHDYVEEAVSNGAVAILAEKKIHTTVPVIYVTDTNRAIAMLAATFYRFPTSELPVIGVTGTNGKTTVTYLLEAIFSGYGMKTGVIGTIQLKIGEYTEPIKNTTPNALYLQKTFRRMINMGVEIALMEVSSHALDMGRLYGTDIRTAIYTNISQDHLDYHKTMESYIHAKGLLFAQMGNQYVSDQPKFAILNKDDAASEIMERNTAQAVMTYGLYGNRDVKAKDVKLSRNGTTFIIQAGDISERIHSKLLGHFNIYNMLAAATAALSHNIPPKAIKRALGTVTGVPGRFEQVDAGQTFSVIVDYAHTPDSLENVLQTIGHFSEGNVIIVVGCGGDRDRSKRPLMADMALKYADWCYFTSDNPRTEDPKDILHDMTKGIDAVHFTVIEDRKQAIQAAISCAENDDIILIAGKGHETYQQIGLKKYYFDDKAAAKAAIRNKEL